MDKEGNNRLIVIPEDEMNSEIAPKQHMLQSQPSSGDLKNLDSVTPIGTHVLNKDVKDCVLEDCQNQDKCMDLRGDSIAIKFNASSIKLVKCNNFGSGFILKHYVKIHDFALITSKILAVLDKNNLLTFYVKLAKERQVEVPIELSPKKQSSQDGKKKSKKNSKNSEEDIEKYFDTTSFDTHLHFEPQIEAKLIATHPLKENILCVYDKQEIQILWLDEENLSQVTKHMLIHQNSEGHSPDMQEIKSVVFTKDALICVMYANGYVNIYNYEIENQFKGGFHPYADEENEEISIETSTAKTNLLTSSLFCPMIEVNHQKDGRVAEFKAQKNLISQGTLVTSRYKNSEFTVWDLEPLLNKSKHPRKMHVVDTTGRTKAKKCYLDFASNTLFFLMKNKTLIMGLLHLGFGNGRKDVRVKKVYLDLVSKKKDNNTLQHIVGRVNMQTEGQCYAQSFIRQGKFLWSFGVQVDDDFASCRKDMKRVQKYLPTPSIPSTTSPSPTSSLVLEVNPTYLQNLPPAEEVGNQHTDPPSTSLPTSKTTARRVAKVTLVDDSDDEDTEEVVQVDNTGKGGDGDDGDGGSEGEGEEGVVYVAPNKKCKKTYLRFTKNIGKGVSLGMKKGIKEAIDRMDLGFLEQTSKAISYMVNQ